MELHHRPGACYDVDETYGGEEIYNYVDSWYDAIIDSVGTIYKYKQSNFNLDHVCPGRTLLALNKKACRPKYDAAVAQLQEQLSLQPHNEDGGYWHKKVYPSQMWLDGLFMAEPFHAQYASQITDEDERAKRYEECLNQFIVAAAHTYDAATGLYRHAYDDSREMFWCDKTTGQSAHCWGRALGWYAMAIVEVLDYIPSSTPGYDKVVEILRGIIAKLPEYADAETGMWYQVMDCPGREGNYLESTGSAMFSYVLLKGVRTGLLSAELKQYAIDTYDNFVKCFVTEDENGLLSINDCCAVAGLGGKESRAGDYAYYLSEPVRSNDAKGVGPFIWASLEFERL